MPKPSVLSVLRISILFAALVFVAHASLPGSTAPEPVVWSTINIPAEGNTGKWQLAAGSDVSLLTGVNDGTLYVYATPSGSNYTLFKSVDNGMSWTASGQVDDPIIAMGTATDDAKVVYYATNTTVYKSSDAGLNFGTLSSNPGGAGNNNVTITSIAVTFVNNSRVAAVGTMDRDSGQFGGVYTLNESDLDGGWTDTGLRTCDVISIAFSPNYAVDRQLIAVGSSENGTVVSFRSGSSTWGTTSGNASIEGIVPQDAVIALPADYTTTFFLGIDTGNNNGEVFQVNRLASPNVSIFLDLNVAAADNLSSVDVSGLAVSGSSGSYYIVAGASSGSRVYMSNNGGQTWARGVKEPTGGSKTQIRMAPDFATSRKVYAGTSGSGSALSYSTDAGTTWNQLSMIDTSISAITDFAVSPRYNQDNTLFLLTWGGEHSLWRSHNSGTNWERVFTGSLGGADSFSHLELSPQYGATDYVVVMAGMSGQGTIWKSSDRGQTFIRRIAGFPIDTLAVNGNENYYVGSYNGTNGLVYRTSDSGSSYSTPSVVGSQPLNTIAFSPSFQQDKTVLAGNSNGWVYLSTDDGVSFATIPGGTSSPPLTGNIFVAFDWQFVSSRIVYAAGDNASTSSNRSRLYRYTLGKSQQWENLDTTLEIGGKPGQLVILPGGSLYAVNSHDNGGMERSLNPAATSYTVFEKINAGLSNNAAMNGLWGSGNQLWSIDTRNNKLMTYVDSLIAPVVPGNPIAGASGVDTRSATLDWGGLAGAVTYEWQVDNNGSFSSVGSAFQGETPSTSAKLPRLEPASSYYWRVRVKEPTLSPWSPVRSFFTLLGTSVPELYSPGPGAAGVATKPVFQWAAIGGAEKYELIVAPNTSFANPVVALLGNNALPTNVWQCDTNLSYNTTYFWRIRGISSTSYSSWSGVGMFTTLIPQAPAPPSLSIYKVELVSPKVGAQGVGLKPVFEWKVLSGADKYELLVSASSSFTDAVIARIGSNAIQASVWQSEINLGHQTTYYWRVRGVNGNNVSAWSEVNSFTTIPLQIDPPAKIVIVLENPEAGDEGVSLKPIFQWKPVPGADRYELVVSKNYLFTDTVIAKQAVNALPVTAWQSDISLAYLTTYYWKVRAISGGNLSAWSDTSAFITITPPPVNITAVELEIPKAGAEGVSTIPVFQWKSVAGGRRYELLVASSPSFTGPVIAKIGDEALSGNVWRSDVNLENGTTYFWKVKAVTGDNASTWSDISIFSTIPRPPAARELSAKTNLGSADLVSPNGAVKTGTKPLFEWKNVAGADKYELLVAPEVSFANPIIIRTGNYAISTASWVSEVELAYDTTFFWKIRAISENSSGDWSVPGVFITEPLPVQTVPEHLPALPSWVINTGIALLGVIGLLLAVVSGLLIVINRR